MFFHCYRNFKLKKQIAILVYNDKGKSIAKYLQYKIFVKNKSRQVGFYTLNNQQNNSFAGK